MRKAILIFAGIFFLLLSGANAQTKATTDYFVGKWNLLIEGTPNGDAKSVLVLERKDGKLTGSMGIKERDLILFSKVEENEKSITAYFVSNGYDVYFSLEKKDDDHAEGSMMNMFTTKATRIVETTEK